MRRILDGITTLATALKKLVKSQNARYGVRNGPIMSSHACGRRTNATQSDAQLKRLAAGTKTCADASLTRHGADSRPVPGPPKASHSNRRGDGRPASATLCKTAVNVSSAEAGRNPPSLTVAVLVTRLSACAGLSSVLQASVASLQMMESASASRSRRNAHASLAPTKRLVSSGTVAVAASLRTSSAG